mmetsp:Transcript_13982/g.31785  ORF Transcript_13982/g.31785 Transcript_13982/m.31785 type:complete len:108 (-) Transcript_13982:156-479(-)
MCRVLLESKPSPGDPLAGAFRAGRRPNDDDQDETGVTVARLKVDQAEERTAGSGLLAGLLALSRQPRVALERRQEKTPGCAAVRSFASCGSSTRPEGTDGSSGRLPH